MPDVNLFKWVRVSLDASNAEEYLVEKGRNYFNKVMSNIRAMSEQKENTLLGVGYVVSRRNYKNVPSLIDKLIEMGVDYFQIRHVEESPRLDMNKNQIDALRLSLEEYMKSNSPIKVYSNISPRYGEKNNKNLPCSAHSLNSIIHANGDVFLCEKRRHDSVNIGNINEQDFKEIWGSNKRISASKKFMNPESQIGCEVCRMTKFNELFYDLSNTKTINFI